MGKFNKTTNNGYFNQFSHFFLNFSSIEVLIGKTDITKGLTSSQNKSLIQSIIKDNKALELINSNPTTEKEYGSNKFYLPPKYPLPKFFF